LGVAIIAITKIARRIGLLKAHYSVLPLNAELKAKLKDAAPLKQAELYANAKIWHESLAIAASIRPTNSKAWRNF
jgi:hypothetical protein